MKRNQVSNELSKAKGKSWVIQLLQSYFAPLLSLTLSFLYVHNFFPPKCIFYWCFIFEGIISGHREEKMSFE